MIDQYTPDRKFTVLLVDDKKENLMVLEEILNTKNRVFLKAKSGDEALKLALKHKDIGLIMLDVQMPEMDGFEVAELLKHSSKTKNISIIFVTAVRKEESSILKGFSQGSLDYLAVDYLLKPLDINVTRAKVNVFEQLYFDRVDLKTLIEQKEKINSQLERFTYMVAHDLKSPITGIKGIISLIQEDELIANSKSLKESMDVITAAFEHLSQMIESILDYSRKTSLEQSIEKVDVHQLVEQISNLLFPPKHITIEIDNKLPTIVTNKFKLLQVFQNLIGNSIKHNDKKAGKIIIGYTEKADHFDFYVKDNGPGIDNEDQHRVFNLFETAGKDPLVMNKSGIGLNVTKALVAGQGGAIKIESRLGEGSIFTFEWMK